MPAEAGREQQQPAPVQPARRRRGRRRRAAAWRRAPSATIAIGMLTKKIQRHDALSTIRPPITGPKIGPSSVGTPITAMTRPSAVRPGGLGEHAHADRHDHAAAEALQDAEEDQRLGRPGQAAQRRAERRTARPRPSTPSWRPKRSDIQPVSGITIGQREHVAGRDPLDRVQRGVELARQRLERDVDDRRVEDRHDHADGDDGGDDPDLAAERLVGGRRCGRTGVRWRSPIRVWHRSGAGPGPWIVV